MTRKSNELEAAADERKSYRRMVAGAVVGCAMVIAPVLAWELRYAAAQKAERLSEDRDMRGCGVWISPRVTLYGEDAVIEGYFVKNNEPVFSRKPLSADLLGNQPNEGLYAIVTCGIEQDSRGGHYVVQSLRMKEK